MAMADEDSGDEKKKFPLVKVIVLSLLVLILLAGAVGATLFFTGFFDAKDAKGAEEKLQQLEQAAVDAKDPAKAPEPKLVPKASPELQRFQFTYLELERDLLANLTASRKVMQVQLAVMTRYDERVFKNVKKHEFALRAAALDVMRQTTEADLDKPDFRKDLSEKIRNELNARLEKFEDFGGIEEVYFTSFVIQ
jgi:flagellar FliL protein